MKRIQSLPAIALALSGAGAFAQTANMAVSATIAGSCSVVANPLAFSVYDPLSATALTVQTTAVITCTTGAGASLAMGIGANSTGTGATAQRRMRVGATANYVSYNIYQPSGTAEGAACAYTTPWGNGTTGGNTLAIGVAPTPTSRTYNVCGEIPALQAAAVGSYVDTVVVTANL
ncbi:spore coat protein U domain-containing protein [Ramlibacter terrae]|uniref:Spore coat protein U domain-containing protein n=1 Tax=Ramlibacter terrae TaxID=2732511 RepID=A0ABX6P2I8_9BURK|nr:spore coat protein U domain-containing protein [Ramlibacter terrae]